MQITVQLFPSCILGTWAYKATNRVICYHTPLRNLWSKNILLAKCLAKSPHILHFPSQTYKMCYCTSRHTKKNLSCSQEMAARCRLSSEKQLIFYLFWFSVMELSPGKRRSASRLNSQWFSFPRVYTFCMQYCICAQDVILQQGRTAASGPSLPSQ